MIKRYWSTIGIAYFIIMYLIIIVFLHGSWPLLLASYLAFLLLTFFLFMGSAFGIIGLFCQSILKKNTAAEFFYRYAHQLGTDNAQILTAYGLLLLRQAKPEEAAQIFDQALSHSHHFITTKTIKANQCICEWKLNQVEKAYQHYLELYYYPNRTPIENFSQENLTEGEDKNSHFTTQDFVSLGYLAMINGNHDEAIYFSQVALIKSPQSASAYDNLGQVYYRLNQPAESEKHFKKALEFNKNLIDSLYYLARLSIDKNDPVTAKKYLTSALEQPVNRLNTVSQEELETLKASID